MRILAIDIGLGTQDVMVYDTRDGFEEAYKLVLPSPTRFFANRIRAARGDLVICGDTMGGGPFSRAVYEHLKRYKVYMTEKAARTLRDDLDFVAQQGVELIADSDVEQVSKHAELIRISDFNPDILKWLSHFGVDISFDAIAVAVQDHGVAPKGVTDRENRFRMLETRVGSALESFAFFDHVPVSLSRMYSLFNSLRSWYSGHILMMDTGPAAILGSLEDERVRTHRNRLCINVGNGHTIAFSLLDERVIGIFEHHTRLLDRTRLEYYLKKLVDGDLTFEEVFEDGGHGAIVIERNSPEVVALTGPKREKMRGIGLYAAPAGDMMMTGPVGLIKATLSQLQR